VLIDTAVHSEHGNVIKCDFKPGSVERCIDLDEEGLPQAGDKFISRHQ
jgi:hypothetical protein